MFVYREIDMGAQCIVEMEGKKTTLFKPNRPRDNLNEFTFDYSYASMDDNDQNYVAQDQVYRIYYVLKHKVFNCHIFLNTFFGLFQVYEDLGTDVIECAFQGNKNCV